jgi:hypothetical protein
MSDDEKIVENLKEIKISDEERFADYLKLRKSVTKTEEEKNMFEILMKYGHEIHFVVAMKRWFEKECGDVSDSFVYSILVRDIGPDLEVLLCHHLKRKCQKK